MYADFNNLKGPGLLEKYYLTLFLPVNCSGRIQNICEDFNNLKSTGLLEKYYLILFEPVNNCGRSECLKSTRIKKYVRRF